jgi:hypothetical protein
MISTFSAAAAKLIDPFGTVVGVNFRLRAAKDREVAERLRDETS